MIIGVAEAFTVNHELRQPLDAAFSDEQSGGPSQLIVSRAPNEAAAVPGADRLVRHVIQRPTFARCHARLVNLDDQGVVGVAPAGAGLGVTKSTLIRFA